MPCSEQHPAGRRTRDPMRTRKRSFVRRSPAPGRGVGACGFTLVELLVVMAIIATLLTIALPRYFTGIDRSREAVLRENLRIMRSSIDQYHADHDRYPDDLQALAAKRYIRSVPQDPITDSAGTWVIVPPPATAGRGLVYDVRSGAPGNALDGTTYRDW